MNQQMGGMPGQPQMQPQMPQMGGMGMQMGGMDEMVSFPLRCRGSHLQAPGNS